MDFAYLNCMHKVIIMDSTKALAVPLIFSYILSKILERLGVSEIRIALLKPCFEFLRIFTQFAFTSHVVNPDVYTIANFLQEPAYNLLYYLPLDVMCFIFGIFIQSLIYEIRVACFYFQVFFFLATIDPAEILCIYNGVRVIMVINTYYQLRNHTKINDIAISSLFGIYCLVVLNYYSNMHYFGILLLDFQCLFIFVFSNVLIFAISLFLTYVRSTSKIVKREINIWIFIVLFIGHGSCILLWLNVVMLKWIVDFDILDYFFWLESSVIMVGMISHKNERPQIVFPNFVLSLWISTWIGSWILSI
jgi:hypothetical protein